MEASRPGTRQQLDPRVIEVHRISHAIFTGVLLLAALLTSNVAAFAGGSWRQALLFALLALAGVGILWRLGYRWAQTSYDHTWYRVAPDGISIARGVFWRRTISVPRSRIQHTDVTQGPLQRSFGLSTLVLYTAGAEHARIALDGLAFDTALALREDLLRSEGAETLASVAEPATHADLAHAADHADEPSN